MAPYRPPRDDSSIEPPAYARQRWPTPAPPPPHLMPALSPKLRVSLPQPKPLRPPQSSLAPPPHSSSGSSFPVPAPSDLSAASTRAELEPVAVKDLRRVTARLHDLDPWMRGDRMVKRVSEGGMADRLREVGGGRRVERGKWWARRGRRGWDTEFSDWGRDVGETVVGVDIRYSECEESEEEEEPVRGRAGSEAGLSRRNSLVVRAAGFWGWIRRGKRGGRWSGKIGRGRWGRPMVV